ncbi:MAG: cytochrome c oxidase subunit II [Chloroflexi bacterium]|nr:cytochrome c oxidase subunit II [Chloroflexota bacterium]MBT4073987.1 cytochrome c oxidase subunit II [Chloroflexota bacterium]MBT4513561.1 cytochrome c oxidase subunit II [Chloroflexota bacterium]MBT5319597.1 cytochrome c oxidase subunit II [Chloroflexota bacterium]MBT6680645.1 cytochrome c oxidase subunit II [Chloroflexota bacterium]
MINRDTVTVGIIWIIATVLVEIGFTQVDIFPAAASEEAVIVDDAFNFLTYLAIPIFTFILIALVYSGFKFKNKPEAEPIDGGTREDGPPVRTHRTWVWGWMVVTSALVVTVIIHPGLTGLNEVDEIAQEDNLELVIEATGVQWAWTFTYPDQGLTTNELVLPLDTHVRFDVKAVDVLHSFWIPAFRTKIDAVPGLTTQIHANITELGNYDDDVNFRVQCAELCGRDHAIMRSTVEVVEREEFNEWVLAQQ